MHSPASGGGIYALPVPISSDAIRSEKGTVAPNSDSPLFVFVSYHKTAEISRLVIAFESTIMGL